MSKGAFCYRCGKKGVPLIEGLCPECYFELHQPKIPKKIVIKRCRECGRIWIKGRWVFPTREILESYLRELIGEKVRVVGDAVSVLVEREIGGKTFRSEDSVRLEWKEVLCPDCLRAHSRAWEVKIQIRWKDREKPRLLSYLLEKVREEVDVLGGYFWTERLREGLDIFVQERSVGKRLVRRISKEIGERAVESKSFVGLDKRGKKRVKYTYLFRL